MDSVSIFFILDGPKLQAQAVLLAASLRYFNKDRYKQMCRKAALRIWLGSQEEP